MLKHGCPCGEPERCMKGSFFVSANEYLSKTEVTCIEKTNTNVTCNYCQAKYDDLECCKRMNLLQAMACITWK